MYLIKILKRSILVSVILMLIWVFVDAITTKDVYLLFLPKENEEVPNNKSQMEALHNEKDLENNGFTPVFEIMDLPNYIIDKITGVSWHEDAPVGLEDLSYLNLTYWDFDEQLQIGELIVHRKVAQEVVEIFQELYEAKYPIAKMRLIDEYYADDNLSMKDNNTSAFCYRVVEGTNVISTHSYGLAIDINPVQNPYIVGGKVLPIEGKEFLDRENVRKGMIVKGDPAYNAFKSRGWTWGGDWTRVKDYHHFQKDIDLN